MRILLIYATNSGGTQMAAGIVSDTLAKKGHEVVIKDVKEVNADELANYKLIVLGSPSWDYEGREGQPHEDFLSFMEKFKENQLQDKQFAAFGLGDSSYTHFCGAVDVLTDFIQKSGGKAVTDPLKIDGYFFDQEKNNRIIIDWTNQLADKLS